MKTIDTRGELCPTPLIMTKRAITGADSTESFEILSDNDTARCNLLNYLEELGIEAACSVDGDHFRITFDLKKVTGDSGKDEDGRGSSKILDIISSLPEPDCHTPLSTSTYHEVSSHADTSHSSTTTQSIQKAISETTNATATGSHSQKPSGYAIVFKSQAMGLGDDSLGAILMRACINSLSELDILPQVIILYNAGVMLATKDGDTAESLIELNEQGVEIIVCGTCVDFYGIKEQLAVGTISNMYKINTLLSEVTKVIYP